MTTKTEAMPTIGEIARRLGEPIHRVAYVIRSRNIAPAATAGNSRVFTEADVSHIAGEIRHINAEREGLEP